MPTANGKITAPISIEDVRRTLGAASTDDGTLCTHPNVNYWSLHVPAKLTGVGVRMTEKTQGLQSTPTGNLASQDEYNIVDRLDKPVNYSTSQDNPETGYGAWKHKDIRPTGSSTSPYRINDFEQYYHNARFLSRVFRNGPQGDRALGHADGLSKAIPYHYLYADLPDPSENDGAPTLTLHEAATQMFPAEVLDNSINVWSQRSVEEDMTKHFRMTIQGGTTVEGTDFHGLAINVTSAVADMLSEEGCARMLCYMSYRYDGATRYVLPPTTAEEIAKVSSLGILDTSGYPADGQEEAKQREAHVRLWTAILEIRCPTYLRIIDICCSSHLLAHTFNGTNGTTESQDVDFKPTQSVQYTRMTADGTDSGAWGLMPGANLRPLIMYNSESHTGIPTNNDKYYDHIRNCYQNLSFYIELGNPTAKTIKYRAFGLSNGTVSTGVREMYGAAEGIGRRKMDYTKGEMTLDTRLTGQKQFVQQVGVDDINPATNYKVVTIEPGGTAYIIISGGLIEEVAYDDSYGYMPSLVGGKGPRGSYVAKTASDQSSDAYGYYRDEVKDYALYVDKSVVDPSTGEETTPQRVCLRQWRIRPRYYFNYDSAGFGNATWNPDTGKFEN